MESTPNQNSAAPAPIDLSILFIRFKRALSQIWPIVLILAVLGAAGKPLLAWRSFVPKYQSKAIFTVDTNYGADDIFSYGNYYDNMAAQQLASSFPQLLHTDVMQDLVREELGGAYPNGTAVAAAVADTNMMTLTVQSTSAQDAYDYLCAIMEAYPKVAVYMADYPEVIIRQSPQVASTPYNSFNWQTQAIKGCIYGLAVGLVLVGILMLMTNTVSTADELKEIINLPILVSLPQVLLKKRRTANNMLITASSDSNLAESLRGLRVKVKRLLPDDEKKVFSVTSALAGEGKTTIAINLALSLADDGQRVVLIDSDLRNQSIGRKFNVSEGSKGLMDLLEDPKLSPLDILQDVPGSSLTFISGKSTDKRHYNIECRAMRRILGALQEHYDYIIMDAPPMEVVSDTATICRYSGTVLFVVKQDYAQKSHIINAVTALHQRDIKIGGCIFNSVPQRHNSYGYGYGYGSGKYGYGYGKRYGYGYGSKGRYGYGAKPKSVVSNPRTPIAPQTPIDDDCR